jgi:hypothetical protein
MAEPRTILAGYWLKKAPLLLQADIPLIRLDQRLLDRAVQRDLPHLILLGSLEDLAGTAPAQHDLSHYTFNPTFNSSSIPSTA